MQQSFDSGFTAISNLLAYFNVFKIYHYDNYSTKSYNDAKYLKEVGKKFCIKFLDDANNVVSGTKIDLAYVKINTSEIRELAKELSANSNPSLIKNTNNSLDKIEEFATFLTTEQCKQIISDAQELKEIKDKIYFLRYDRCILLW